MWFPVAVTGGLFETGAFWQQVASVFASAALWAQQRATHSADPIDELMFRLRNPVQFTLRHPIVALRRKADRRRARNG